MSGNTETNYKLDTTQGMKNGIQWFLSFIRNVAQGGIWAVPRAMSGYKIDHEGKTISLMFGEGDRPTERVAKAAGWEVKNAIHA